WPYPSLIRWHFWLVVVGMTIYIVGLSIGGWLQGKAMLDASRPFIDSVRLTIPWLEARTLGGILMTCGHVVFAWNVLTIGFRLGPGRTGGARLQPLREEVAHA